ncbi:MAG: PQQ-binding-like beta-propeller repeat protein [Candidatus Firestonebacteria bacterium]
MAENNGNTVNSWKKALIKAAAVFGVFTILALSGVTVLYMKDKDKIIKVTALTELKKELEKDPNNTVMKEKIREADLKERQEYFGAVALMERGKYALLLILAFFIVVAKAAVSVNPKPPKVRKGIETDTTPSEKKINAYVSLSLVFAALCAGMLAVMFFDSSSYFLSLRAPEPMKEEEWGGGETEEPSGTAAVFWPGFRGPGGDGLALKGVYPVKFDLKTGENIKWKIPLKATGYGSPIICGNKVLLTGSEKGKFKMLCYDLNDGKLLWNKEAAPAAKKELEIMTEEAGGSGLAASTPATDGKFVYALFPSADLFCFDLKGNIVWQKNLGEPESSYGLAVSPLLCGDKIILQLDKLKSGGLLLALNTKDGSTAWQTKRENRPSWSTPLIAELSGKKCIITFADPEAVVYDAADGKELWKAGVINGEISSSPAVFKGVVYAASSMSLYALSAEGKQLWEAEKDTTINSPVTDGKFLVLAQAGNIACYSCADGKLLWRQDVKGDDFWSSPVLSENRVFVSSINGKFIVFELAETYKELALIETGEKVYATPAFADGMIVVRTNAQLYCIGK